MPTLIKTTTFYDIYGNSYSKYTANSGDAITMRIDFSNCCCITSSLTQQITYSQLTGEVKISEGSWIDEGFRVGDSVTFQSFNELNVSAGIYNLTIIAIPTDKIIVVSGLPALNNATTPDKYIWQFWVNKQKEEMEFSVNWVENKNTSATPSMNSLIDSESQRMNLTGMNSLVITNGVGVGTILSQVGKRSGSFAIGSPRIWRFNDDNFGGATRYNYVLMFELVDFGFLFPTFYQGSDCLKLVTKIALKTKIGDTKTSDLYYLDNGNTGNFNEAFNSDVSKVTVLPSAITTLPFNIPTEIPFSITINNTLINTFEIGASYSTLDDTYNENQFDAQNKYLKILKSGLIGTPQIGSTYNSDYFVNEYFSIQLQSLNITTSGSTKTFSGILYFNPRYNTTGFGNFIEGRGASDRQLYLWIKIANTNCLLFGNQMTFEYPVGKELFPFNKQIINHDDNTIHDDMLTTGFTYATDINSEDDLGFFADIWLNTLDSNKAVQIDVVCTISGSEFSLEKMSFDVSTQDFSNWIPMTQNVSNNLPTSSAKKQAYLKKKGVHSLGIIVRLYYPFLIRWEYWLKQLNASAYYVANNKNNRNWLNYENPPIGKLQIKLGAVRNGVLDFDYTQLNPKIYDYDTNIISTIELIDNSTGATTTSIVKGKIYTVKATHYKTVGNWVLYPYGQITIEPKESAPRFVISTEIDADISPLNPLIGNSAKRLDVTKPDLKTVIYTCTFDATNIPGNDYCFTSKISEQGVNNNPIFEVKITEDNIDKITEDTILKQIE